SLLLLHTLFFADVNPYVNPLAMDRNKVSSSENSSRLNPLSYTRSPTPGPGHANRPSLSSLANAKGSKAAASITLLIQLCSFPFSRNSTGTTTSNAFSAAILTLSFPSTNRPPISAPYNRKGRSIPLDTSKASGANTARRVLTGSAHAPSICAFQHNRPHPKPSLETRKPLPPCMYAAANTSISACSATMGLSERS
ncbi:hypothetical protein NGA_2098800, partial [Nannochloropsis gaditana CCMP526]|uniref:uncharacterized protein n=1 Tax=Nannochloropsis gaditana (strain CCMP526) TaxID=1093141 RepID=UPI00029F5E36